MNLSVAKNDDSEKSLSPVGIKNEAGEWVAYVRSKEEAAALVQAKNFLPALVAIAENSVEIIARLDGISDKPVAGKDFLENARAVLAMLNGSGRPEI